MSSMFRMKDTYQAISHFHIRSLNKRKQSLLYSCDKVKLEFIWFDSTKRLLAKQFFVIESLIQFIDEWKNLNKKFCEKNEK